MGIIVIRRTGHDLQYHHTRSVKKGRHRVDKWRAIERHSRSGAEVPARECAAARCLTSKLVLEAFPFLAIRTRSYTEPG